MKQHVFPKNLSDYAGVLNSGICLIHCFATPLLLSLQIGIIQHPVFHYLFLLVSFISVYYTTLHNKSTSITLLLWISFFGLTAGTLFEEAYPFLHYLTYTSSFSLILGHVLNIKKCKSCTTNKNLL